MWKIEVSEAAERDLELLFHHLADSYLEFGSSRREAAVQARRRVQQVYEMTARIARAPLRGESHADWMPGLRHLTLDKAIYWYLVEEVAQRVCILAVFYGSQDHQRRMLRRLLESS